jgi:hypothetical protein
MYEVGGGGGDKRIFLFISFSDLLWGPPSLLLYAYRGSFPFVQWPENKDNQSPPSRAKVKKEWSYTSTPPTLILGMDRENVASLNVKPNIVVQQIKLLHSNIPMFELQPMNGLAGMRSRVFRDMRPCNMAHGYRRFGEQAASIFRVAAYSLKSVLTKSRSVKTQQYIQ